MHLPTSPSKETRQGMHSWGWDFRHLDAEYCREINHSETAFVFTGSTEFPIRYFTPESEIPLCGHATLAAAHIMYETGMVNKSSEIILLSKAGRLVIKYSDGWIIMNFPAYQLEQLNVPDDIHKFIGIRPEEYYRTAHGWSFVFPEKMKKRVRSLQPDFRLFEKLWIRWSHRDGAFCWQKLRLLRTLFCPCPGNWWGSGYRFCALCACPVLE